MNCLIVSFKDLRLLFRDRMAAFFVIGFPIMMGLFFGVIFQGPGPGGSSPIQIVVVDLDESPQSQQLIADLKSNRGLEMKIDEIENARQSVRLGQLAAMIVIPESFGQSVGFLWQEQPDIQLGVDPSRMAEGAMLEGMIMQAVGQQIGSRFQQPTQFIPSIREAQSALLASDELDPVTKTLIGSFFDTATQMVELADRIPWDGSTNSQPEEEGVDQGAGERAGDRNGGPNRNESAFQLQLANIKRVDVTREIDPNSNLGQLQKLRSDWDISFPQAMMWGIMGCVAGFSVSIARERSQGTMMRLQAAPLTKTQILIGKGLACFLACLLVITMMTGLGLVLGMRPISFPKLIIAGIATSFCFVGVMMTFSVLGKSEESVAGAGWAANIIMAMFGGGMVPVMFMPSFMQSLSQFSPIYWALKLIEGAIWRDFTWWQMLPGMGVLAVIGLVFMAVGSSILSRRD